MKNLILILIVLVSLAGTACSSNPAKEEATQEGTATTEAAADTTQLAYVCPMGCEGSASNEPGKCKVCGMGLVKNEAHKAHADSAAAPAH